MDKSKILAYKVSRPKLGKFYIYLWFYMTACKEYYRYFATDYKDSHRFHYCFEKNLSKSFSSVANSICLVFVKDSHIVYY